MRRIKQLVILVFLLNVLVGCKDPNPKATPPKSIGKNQRLRASSASVSGSVGPPASVAMMDLLPSFRWTQYRGPNGDSIANPDKDPPVEWGDNQSLIWTSELPGSGSSSPILFQGHILVTATTASPVEADDADTTQPVTLQHHLICMNYFSGAITWKRDIAGPVLPECVNDETREVYGYASSTPVTDGKMVYAYFGKSGVFAFDMTGKLVWKANVGSWENTLGAASPLLLHEDLLIVNASNNSGAVYAFDKKTGRGIWRIEDVADSAAMPIVAKDAEGKSELIVLQRGLLRGFDPATGAEYWRCRVFDSEILATPCIADGVCYCNGGSRLMAVTIGGKGDVTESAILWDQNVPASVASSIYLTGSLFLVTDHGELKSFDAGTGEELGAQKIPTEKPVYAAPLLIGNSLYIPTLDSGVYVCEANTTADKIAHSQFEEDPLPFMASLAVAGDRILLRNDRKMYCIGENPDAPFKMMLSHFERESEMLEGVNLADAEGQGWLSYIDPNLDVRREQIGKEFAGVLTEEQLAKANSLLNANRTELSQLGDELNDVWWGAASAEGQPKGAEAQDAITRIRSEVDSKLNEIRTEIQSNLSAEQLSLIKTRTNKTSAETVSDAAHESSVEPVVAEEAEAETAAGSESDQGKDSTAVESGKTESDEVNQ